MKKYDKHGDGKYFGVDEFDNIVSELNKKGFEEDKRTPPTKFMNQQSIGDKTPVLFSRNIKYTTPIYGHITEKGNKKIFHSPYPYPLRPGDDDSAYLTLEWTGYVLILKSDNYAWGYTFYLPKSNILQEFKGGSVRFSYPKEGIEINK